MFIRINIHDPISTYFSDGWEQITVHTGHSSSSKDNRDLTRQSALDGRISGELVNCGPGEEQEIDPNFRDLREIREVYGNKHGVPTLMRVYGDTTCHLMNDDGKFVEKLWE